MRKLVTLIFREVVITFDSCWLLNQVDEEKRIGGAPPHSTSELGFELFSSIWFLLLENIFKASFSHKVDYVCLHIVPVLCTQCPLRLSY